MKTTENKRIYLHLFGSYFHFTPLLYKSGKFKAQTGGGTPYYARKNTAQTKIQTLKTHFPCFLNANTCVNQKNIVTLHCQLEIKTLAQGPES